MQGIYMAGPEASGQSPGSRGDKQDNGVTRRGCSGEGAKGDPVWRQSRLAEPLFPSRLKVKASSTQIRENTTRTIFSQTYPRPKLPRKRDLRRVCNEPPGAFNVQPFFPPFSVDAQNESLSELSSHQRYIQCFIRMFNGNSTAVQFCAPQWFCVINGFSVTAALKACQIL